MTNTQVKGGGGCIVYAGVITHLKFPGKKINIFFVAVESVLGMRPHTKDEPGPGAPSLSVL